MSELKRSLGLMGAAGVSIGAIIGAGIFVLSGVASGLAGPAVTLSCAIAGIVAFLTALSSAELSSFITESGGSYIYTHKAFGKFWGYLVGWMQSFDYIVGASAIIFFAFVGFNTVTVIAEEVKDPEKNVPRAIMLAFIICTLLYIGVSSVSVGLLNWKILGTSDGSA